MNTKEIFMYGVIIITAIFLIVYCVNEKDHQKELERIKIYEETIQREQEDLEKQRARTIPCHVTGLDNPRDCYFKSDYSCSWNNTTKRCEKK